MKQSLILLLTIIFAFSCAPKKHELTFQERENEKNEIIQVMEKFNRAAETKNFSAMVETLAGEVIFFGTDSSEAIKTFADFKKAMVQQWEDFDKMVYGELVDISIQMDESAQLASIIFGVPLTVTIDNTSINLFLRVARTLRKEKGKWVIVSGIVGNVGPSKILMLEELLQKKKNPAEETEEK